MRIRIGERVWRISHKPPTRTASHELDGRVDYDRKVIFIHPDLKGKALLETLIHEGMHASFPQLSEDAVDMAAKEITRLLRKFGFEQTE